MRIGPVEQATNQEVISEAKKVEPWELGSHRNILETETNEIRGHNRGY